MPTGYISYRGIVHSCTVAKTGNVISNEYGADILYRAGSRHPAVRATREEAQSDTARHWAARTRREAKCDHDWTPVSHEEEHCSRCGAYRSVPDLPDVPATARMTGYRSQLRAQGGAL